MDSFDHNSNLSPEEIRSILSTFGITDPNVDPNQIDLTKIDLSQVDLSQFGNLSQYLDVSKIDISKLNLRQFGINDVHRVEIRDLQQITKLRLEQININDLHINHAIKLSNIHFYGFNFSKLNKHKIDMNELFRTYNSYTHNPKEFTSQAIRTLIYLGICYGIGFLLQFIGLILAFCDKLVGFSLLYLISTFLMIFGGLFICPLKKFISSFTYLPHIVASVILLVCFLFCFLFAFSTAKGVVVMFWLVQIFDMIFFYVTLYYLTWELTKQLISRFISKYITKSGTPDLQENLINEDNDYHGPPHDDLDPENPVDVGHQRPVREVRPHLETGEIERPLVNIPETNNELPHFEEKQENVEDDHDVTDI